MCRLVIALLLSSVILGCTTTNQTTPERSATEQLLISKAADDAAAKLVLDVPTGTKVWIDDSRFEGIDGKYAIGAIRESILKQGFQVVDKASAADVIVEIRAGALSIDESDMLFGIRSFEVPIPLSAAPRIPEIALFKRDKKEGVAKIAALAYDAEDGTLIAASDPTFGFSHRTRWNVLLFISWTTSNIIPEDARE